MPSAAKAELGRRAWESVPDHERSARMKPVASARLFGHIRTRVDDWLSSGYATVEQRQKLANLLLDGR